jgi:PIN domain nuclease of toxin-antitoxin system
MIALIDAHAFLWFVDNDRKSSVAARTFMGDPNNDLRLSLASLWEIAIKVSSGKLTLNNRA